MNSPPTWVLLILLLTCACQDDRADLVATPAAGSTQGHRLIRPSAYLTEAAPRGWTIRAPGAPNRREPVEIEVELRPGSAPAGGAHVAVAGRRLTRTLHRVEGGSGGEGRLLVYREPLGAWFAEYRQLRQADGVEPRFELDGLIRSGALAATP